MQKGNEDAAAAVAPADASPPKKRGKKNPSTPNPDNKKYSLRSRQGSSLVEGLVSDRKKKKTNTPTPPKKKKKAPQGVEVTNNKEDHRIEAEPVQNELKRKRSDVAEEEEEEEEAMEASDEKSLAMKERYFASMILAAAGDAIGFRNGKWEFNYDGVKIHKQLEEKYGGLQGLDVKLPKWRVSDDTVMLLATAEALVSPSWSTMDNLCEILAVKYVECFDDMDGRAAGPMTEKNIARLKKGMKWDEIPFDKAGGGCGGAMRSMPVGLMFPYEYNRKNLVAAAVESARITHNHPTGVLGSVASALLTAFSIEDIPAVEWGRRLLTALSEHAYPYLQDMKRDWEPYQKDLKYFEAVWRKYLKERQILEDGQNEPQFPEPYGVPEREVFYKSVSWEGWGGSSGHDATLIAYDALLGAKDSWDELVLRSMLHGGDSDSTGVIAGAWFGGLYGFKDVRENHHIDVEYRDRLESLAQELFQQSMVDKRIPAMMASDMEEEEKKNKQPERNEDQEEEEEQKN